MAAYVAVLFLQINPAVPIRLGTVGSLFGVLLSSYGLLFAFVCYVVMVVRQLLASEPLSPGWVSFRVLVWLSAVGSGIVATLMWLNLRGLRLSLPDVAARHMAQGAALLTLCAALLLVLALLRYSVGQRGVSAGVAGFATVLVVSLLGPLWLRGGGLPPAESRPARSGPAFEAAPSPARVVVLLVDGASLDFISPAVADGRLPNFGRVLDSGAVMHLATLRPTQPGPVWTAVATGKLPFHNGVRSAALYGVPPRGPTLDLLPDFCFAHALVYFGFVRETAQTSASLRARPLWNILQESGVDSAVVRWPLTYPENGAGGIVVSDRAYSPRAEAMEVGAGAERVPALAAGRREHLVPRLAGIAAAGAPADSAGSLALDRLYAETFDMISATPGLRLLALRYQGLDVVGHYYLRQAMPQTFGDVSDEERRKYGRVLEQYYRYLDGEVGRRIDHLGPDDLLLVVSGFGMEPLSLPKRILERVMGAHNVSGTHERAPDGFLMAYGSSVRAGHLPRASVIDVAPTVLYFFGLPIGRDMDGFARTDIFSRAFTEERPLTYIPTYE
jgi:hypothetical protein